MMIEVLEMSMPLRGCVISGAGELLRGKYKQSHSRKSRLKTDLSKPWHLAKIKFKFFGDMTSEV
jgi:hypothetical protein